MKIAIIGAGASGLMAAYSALLSGADVTIYEHGDSAGKKLLMTGNGKCNITNTEIKLYDYHSSSDISDLMHSVLTAVSPNDLIRIFGQIGIPVRCFDSLVYPYTEQARTVRDILLSEIQRLGGKLIYNCDIYRLLRCEKDKFRIESIVYDRMILCCGGKSYKQTGSDGSGHEIAKKLGHSCSELMPSLVKLHADFSQMVSYESNHYTLRPFDTIKGIRLRAGVSIVEGTIKSPKEEKGQVQLTEDGISGICVFQLSGRIGELLKQKTASVSLNLFPDLKDDTLYELIMQSATRRCSDTVIALDLSGLVSTELAAYILELFNQNRQSEGLNDSVHALISFMRDLRIPIRSTDKLEHAQVTRGGISVSEIASTFESKLQKNLYLCGEMLDIDGPCGGYNLHFAFASGYIAGENASK